MHSLRRQLMTGLLGGFAALLAGGGTVVYLGVRDSLESRFDAALLLEALTIIGAIEQKDREVDIDFSDRFVREFGVQQAPKDFFQVFDQHGVSQGRSHSLDDESLPYRYGSLKEPLFWDLALDDGTPVGAIGIRFTPRYDGEQPEGMELVDATVVVAASRRDLDAILQRLRGIFVASGLALLVLAASVVVLVLRRGLRPLARLAEQAAQIDAASLQTRFPTGPMPVELQPICARLNDLLARLQESFERERRFNADLAHELRTPVAELRSQAELALRWPESVNAETHQQSLDIAVQMETLVSRMLALAHAEHSQLPVNREPVSPAALVEEALARHAGRIEERRLAIEKSMPEDARIDTDPVLMRAIVGNLLDNAVQYAAEGDRIRVGLDRSPGRFSLQVANAAGLLTAQDLDRMFDRFWRKDPARTSGERSGLGLSLSRSFAQMLGAQLTARLEGSRLVMTLAGPG
jgi:signal transduction histidine kinase